MFYNLLMLKNITLQKFEYLAHVQVKSFMENLKLLMAPYIYLHSAFFLLQPFVLPLQQYHLRFEVGRVRGDLITKHGGPSTTGVSGSILHGFHLS